MLAQNCALMDGSEAGNGKGARFANETRKQSLPVKLGEGLSTCLYIYRDGAVQIFCSSCVAAAACAPMSSEEPRLPIF